MRKIGIPGIAEGASESAVDGVRGLSILAVILFHLRNGITADFALPPLEPFVANGHLAVKLFFAVSGYLILGSVMAREERSGSVSSAREFYGRRAFRILPLWWLTVIFAFFVLHRMSLASLAANLTFLYGFLEYRADFLPLTIAWSLFAEVCFYATFPLLRRTVRRAEGALGLFGAAFVLAACWRIVGPALGAAVAFDFIGRFPLANFEYFAAGMLVWHLRQAGSVRDVVARLARGRPITTLDFFTLALLVEFVLLGWSAANVFAILVTLLCALQPGTVLHRVAQWKWLRLYGVCCYSIYLNHVFVIGWLEPVRTRLFERAYLDLTCAEIQFAIWYPLVAILSLALGVATYLAIERPFNEWGREMIRRSRAAPIPATLVAGD